MAMSSNDSTGGAGGAGETWDCHTLILNPGAAETTTSISNGVWDNTSGVMYATHVVARYNVATAVTGLRVTTAEDSFETGEFDLYRRSIT